MTPIGLWRRSFPEVVAIAHYHWQLRNYNDAGREYWLAAYVAPTDAEEAEMLRMSWIATERAQGRISELEAAV